MTKGKTKQQQLTALTDPELAHVYHMTNKIQSLIAKTTGLDDKLWVTVHTADFMYQGRYVGIAHDGESSHQYLELENVTRTEKQHPPHRGPDVEQTNKARIDVLYITDVAPVKFIPYWWFADETDDSLRPTGEIVTRRSTPPNTFRIGGLRSPARTLHLCRTRTRRKRRPLYSGRGSAERSTRCVSVWKTPNCCG